MPLIRTAAVALLASSCLYHEARDGAAAFSPRHHLGAAIPAAAAPPSSALKSTAQKKDASPSSGATDLPDYGKTSIEIDDHRLKKIARWRRTDLEGSTLVGETLAEMEGDSAFRETAERLDRLGSDGMTKEERANRRRALNKIGVKPFGKFLAEETGGTWGPALKRRRCEVLQLNVGLYCNQACSHCHVESSPLRTETMSPETAARCLELIRDADSVNTLDITGGAPELNASFRYLVASARDMRPDIDIIDRCNLTVISEPGQEDLVKFLAKHKVHVVASLPCYSAENVDQQRGSGVFDRSISALLALNEAGYGIPGSGLELDLVYNPLGAFLPPAQEMLEEKYKEVLDENFGIRFNQLFTITNMPIKRFADFLHRRDELAEYMDLLVRNFNPGTLDGLMCLNTISVGWDGGTYDCDFNQQLAMSIGGKRGKTVHDVESLDDLLDVPVKTDNHCFGCTSGMGSS